MRGSGSEVAARLSDIAAMETDDSGNTQIIAGRGGLLQVCMQDAHFSHRLIPVSRLEEQLAQGTMGLSHPDHCADLVC